MKPIEYFLTKKGLSVADDLKYLEEERDILQILKEGRKNITQIQKAIIEKKKIHLNWRNIQNKLKLLEKEKLVEEFK